MLIYSPWFIAILITARAFKHGLIKILYPVAKPTGWIRGKILSHSLTQIWIHAVWATKARMPLLSPNIEARVYALLRKQLNHLGCQVSIINGMADHVHCLFMMNKQTSIADTMNQIKGASSHEINKWGNIPDKFAWQSGYSAYSVSTSVLSTTHAYIANQQQHHRVRNIVSH